MIYLIAVILLLLIVVLFLLLYPPGKKGRGNNTVADSVPLEQRDQQTAVDLPEEELELSFDEEAVLEEPELSIEAGEEQGAGRGQDKIFPGGLKDNPPVREAEEIEEVEEFEEIPLADEDAAGPVPRMEPGVMPALADFDEESEARIKEETPAELNERLDFFFTGDEDPAWEKAVPGPVEPDAVAEEGTTSSEIAVDEQDAAGEGEAAVEEYAAGISQEKYEAELDAQIGRLRNELNNAIKNRETPRFALLEKQLTQLGCRRADSEKSFRKQQKLLAECGKLLERLQPEMAGFDSAGLYNILRQGDCASLRVKLTDAAGRLPGGSLASEAWYLCGQLAQAQADFSSAADLYIKASREDEDNHLYLYTAGRMAAWTGNDEDALSLLEKRLAIGEQEGEQAGVLAMTGYELARVLIRQGEKEQAQSLLHKAAEQLEREYGPDRGRLGPVLHELAALYEGLGMYEQAEPLYQRALRIMEQEFGPDYPLLALTLNKLAGLYEEMEQEELSGPLYTRALEIRTNILGEEHPDIGTMLNHLANLKKLEGRYEEAEPMFRRSLAIGEKALGPDHPNLAVVLNNLAELYSEMGREEEASRFQERAFALFELPGAGGDFVELEKDEIDLDDEKNKHIAGR